MNTTIARWLTVVLLLFSTTIYSTEAQFSESSEEEFSEETQTSGIGEYPPCPDRNGNKICVPKDLCDNGRINSKGIIIISLRFLEDQTADRISKEFDKCDRFGVACCELEQSTTTPPPPPATTTNIEEVPDPDWSGQCGERDGSVIGSTTGNETSRWEFPWSVGLFSTVIIAGMKMNVFLCGGILIDDQAVLTAAGCVQQRNRSNLFIHIGRWNINVEKEPSMQVIQVEKVEIHRNYSASNRIGNIALLFLKDSATINSASNRVCLPDRQNLKENSLCHVVGWRDNSVGGASNRLLKVDATHMDRVICTNRIRRYTRTTTYQLPAEHLCADYNHAEAPCGRAEGSSMVCTMHKNSDQFFLVGIASHSVGKCKLKRGIDVFQSTQHYISWIDETMVKHNRYPSYYRPDNYNEQESN